jgi:hypothetical protein
MNDIGERQLLDALARMHEALSLLDEASARGDIAAHLDLAISKLENLLGLVPLLPDCDGEQISRAGLGSNGQQLGESQSA